ncbi:HNH endonuclease [Amycolatopsis sp. NPDC051102]|uniref:HNH endonuclease n=1 Tax=Amycolatopsis sp. NPDC051102 TaxID=3155163 RepID=UPI0034312FF2
MHYVAISKGGTVGLPDWRSPALGTRVRVALWLVSEVGENGTFTKAELRTAFPDVAQAERRMRDLRQAGWEFVTRREDPTLSQEEQRLVKVGSPVWERQHRAAGLGLLTNAVRRQVLDRDRSRCVRCGIGAGEAYPDSPSTTARLGVHHFVPLGKAGGKDTIDNLVTECTRCSDGAREATPPSLTEVWQRIEELSPDDRVRVLAWMVRGKREFSPAEQAFADARRLPPAEREALMSRLAGLVAE